MKKHKVIHPRVEGYIPTNDVNVKNPPTGGSAVTSARPIVIFCPYHMQHLKETASDLDRSSKK